MTKLRSGRQVLPILLPLLALCLVVCSRAHGQAPYADQEIQVHNLPSLTARTHDPSDVLLTSLDTVIHNRDFCCGKDSALEDSSLAADPKSLEDVASRLEGRHLLSDGRPIMVTTAFLPTNALSSGHLIWMILDQHAALMEWNSHLYVVHGVVYFWTYDENGGRSAEIHKLLLWDPRYSDSRREVTFTRGVDDAGNIQGLLFVQAAME
jgi:hypothetical protein